MNEYETWIANHFLSEYPPVESFNELCELIESEDDEILIWQPFEYWPPEDLTRLMSDTLDSLRNQFINK